MNRIFYVKSVGAMFPIKSKNGEEIMKRNVVLATWECRSGDSGPYAAEQAFAVDLIGERAENCALQEGQYIVADLTFATREYNGSYFGDVRLVKYVAMNP